jgi:uncharacterized protein DUF2804
VSLERSVSALPVRGTAARELGLPLPPQRAPLLRGTRPLKRWCWVGAFGPELMLCAGDARIGPLTQRWWAIARPDGHLRERTTARRGGLRVAPDGVSVEAPGVRIELGLESSEGVEVASPAGDGWAWTRKHAPVRATGRVVVDGAEQPVDADAVVDESAGYHPRHTAWRWSAGVGRGEAGERVAWNLVAGVHDAPEASERTVWVDGVPREVGPVEFAGDLSGVGDLAFREWCAREDHTNRLIFRSHYRQPFGTFAGELPGGGPRLAEGYGVMEEHDVYW